MDGSELVPFVTELRSRGATRSEKHESGQSHVSREHSGFPIVAQWPPRRCTLPQRRSVVYEQSAFASWTKA